MTVASHLSRSLVLAVLASGTLYCQPRLVVETPSAYQVGDRVEADSLLMDASGETVTFGEILDPEAKAVVVIVFGGGFKSAPDREQFRGPLWCEDSFDDLGVQRALASRFAEEPVQFVPIAVPPVYKPENFGWDQDPFLGKPDDSEEYRAAVREFIDATEEARATGMLPFEKIYYDPKFRLAQNRKERKLGPEFGEIHPWQGKLKWHLDPRRYGTPTIWILDSEGKILSEPLFGNDYDADPPEIYYGYAEAAARIEAALRRGH